MTHTDDDLGGFETRLLARLHELSPADTATVNANVDPTERRRPRHTLILVAAALIAVVGVSVSAVALRARPAAAYTVSNGTNGDVQLTIHRTLSAGDITGLQHELTHHGVMVLLQTCGGPTQPRLVTGLTADGRSVTTVPLKAGTVTSLPVGFVGGARADQLRTLVSRLRDCAAANAEQQP